MNDINNPDNTINNNDPLSRVYAYFEENREILEKEYSYYECALMNVETKFNILNRQFPDYYSRNPIESISARLKSKDSLIRKINRYNLGLNLDAIKEGINDIAGIRIVCSFIDDIYRLERDFLSQDDVVLLTRKDYIENPKASGYRSLHLIVEVPIYLIKEGKKMVRVEVQMRTKAMDFWASLEHKIRYKKNISKEDLEMISKELLECATLSNEMDNRMKHIRDSIIDARNRSKI